MFSQSLSVATRSLLPLLLLFSVFLLLTGHNEPGGGFAGGLVAAIAVSLHMLGLDLKTTVRLLPLDPIRMIATGLLVATLSGLPGLLRGLPFLTGWWFPRELPVLGGLHVGTPLMFDVGVFMVACGAMLIAVIALEEEH